jgi:hypothetical protein
MVRIKFTAYPRTPVVSPSLSPMASEGTTDVSLEHRESLMEATSQWDEGSEDDNASDDTGDSGNASDNGSRVKIGAKAALSCVSYDFEWSKVTRGRILNLENSFRFFPKGFARLPGIESVLVPKENEAVVYKDVFVDSVHIPPHPVLLDILHKFHVQLHPLMPKAIVRIKKFIWAITSCGARPNVQIFAHHYELHYQNKKIHLEGFVTTFTA